MAKITFTLFKALLLSILVTGSVYAQSKNDKTVVGKVGNTKVTYGELTDNYSSGSEEPYTLSDLKEFLPIYLDYKAKLKSAREKGYYEDSTIVAENKIYTKQAAYAYWLEKQIKPTKFDEYYERANTEVKTAHVLINLGQNPTQAEVDSAKAKLNKARRELLNGASFEEVNNRYSSTRQGRSMGGVLPWLSVGRTVKAFEDVIYSLEIDEISEPFRTRFGVHIVMLLDKREKTRPRKVSHIFFRANNDSVAQEKITSAIEALEEGKSWDEVTNTYSEDMRSKRSGGSIGWIDFGTGYNQDFIDTVMDLDPEKEYSDPIRTSYGYHIFKLDSVQSYTSEQEKRQKLMKRFEDTPYFEKNNSFVIDFLQDKYGEVINEESLSDYKSFITTGDTVSYPEIKLPDELAEKTVYTFKGEEYSISDYHSYIAETHSKVSAPVYMDDWFENYVEHVVDEQIVDLTLSEFPAFEEQIDSYMNGLVVYKINDDSVWSAATVDTSTLRDIYRENPEKYSYDKRNYYHLLSARHDSTLEKAIAFIENGNSPDSVRSEISNIAVTSDSTNTFEGEPYDKLNDLEEQSFSEIFKYNNRKAVFYLNERLPARRMTFTEAFNRLLADYQPEREQRWLKHLRDKYKVKANYNNLEKAFKKDPQVNS